MNHHQMIGLGFELIENLGSNPIYSFKNVFFIRKTDIRGVRKYELLLLIYNAGVTRGRILEKATKRKTPKPPKKIKHDDSRTHRSARRL